MKEQRQSKVNSLAREVQSLRCAVRELTNEAVVRRKELEGRSWYEKPAFWIPLALTASLWIGGVLLNEEQDRRAQEQRAYARLVELTERIPTTESDNLELLLVEAHLLDHQLGEENISYAQYSILADGAAKAGQFETAKIYYDHALRRLQDFTLVDDPLLERAKIYTKLLNMFPQLIAKKEIRADRILEALIEAEDEYSRSRRLAGELRAQGKWIGQRSKLAQRIRQHEEMVGAYYNFYAEYGSGFEELLSRLNIRYSGLDLEGTYRAKNFDPRQILKFYETILQRNPESVFAHNNIAVLLVDFGNYENGRTHYEQALQLDPDYEVVHANLGILLATHFKEYEKAKAHYERALELDPDNVGAHGGLGIILANHFHKSDEARYHYERALELDPDNVGIHINLGILLASVYKDREGAKSHYERALELDPKNEGTLNTVGLLLSQMDEFNEARFQYERSLELDPEQVDIHVRLGILLTNHLQDYKEARTHFERSIEIDPEQVTAHYYLGLLLSTGFQDYEGARLHYERTLELNPGDVVAHTELGDLLSNHLQGYEEARKHYERAVEFDPECVAAHYHLGLLLTTHFQEHEAARAHLERALEIDENNEEVRDSLGRLVSEHFNGT